MERYWINNLCTDRLLKLAVISCQLRNGQLVVVPPFLVRRLKSHFLTLPCGVDLILGLNGYIWISKHVKENEQGEEGFDAEAVYSNVNDVCGINSLTIVYWLPWIPGNWRIDSKRHFTSYKHNPSPLVSFRTPVRYSFVGGIWLDVGTWRQRGRLATRRFWRCIGVISDFPIELIAFCS